MKTPILLSVLFLVRRTTQAIPQETINKHPDLPIPTRPLEWKDVNFLSTSDTHGWLLGHQHATWPEPNYSGDFGTFASFATHLRSMADEKGVDLLLVDAGDHHDGSGLVSSSPDGAARADEIFAMLPYDVVTIGNHELYRYRDAKETYDRRETAWKGRLISSNVNITVEDEYGVWKSVPIGSNHLKFETKLGRKVTAFGVIFKFRNSDRNLTVQSPSLLAKEPWFLEAIADAPDYFVLAGHMPARGETAEWNPVFQAIRNVHPLVPIFIFGGHTHVRDCIQMDERSIAVVPGRYMETIAFTSSNLPNEKDERPLDVARRYLDANIRTYQYHSGKDSQNFQTQLGSNITLQILRLAASLDISTPLGKVPHDLFLARFPPGHPRSVLTEFGEKVIPATVHQEGRDNIKRILIGNAGSQRFDVFQGRFDRNDELTVSPFNSAFLYIPLKAGIAKQITAEMNRRGASKLRSATTSGASSSAAPHIRMMEDDDKVQTVYNDWLVTQWEEYSVRNLLSGRDLEQSFWSGELGTSGAPTLGYVTVDACPGVGDDIEHIPVPVVKKLPDFVVSVFPDVDDDEIIDVAVMDFAFDDFLPVVNDLDPDLNLTLSQMKPYAQGLEINVVWGMYASMAWQR